VGWQGQADSARYNMERLMAPYIIVQRPVKQNDKHNQWSYLSNVIHLSALSQPWKVLLKGRVSCLF